MSLEFSVIPEQLKNFVEQPLPQPVHEDTNQFKKASPIHQSSRKTQQAASKQIFASERFIPSNKKELSRLNFAH